MTEADWLSCQDQRAMFDFLLSTGIPSRKVRLFACACWRAAWEARADNRTRQLVEIAEEFVDGNVSAKRFRTAIFSFRTEEQKPWNPYDGYEWKGVWEAGSLARLCNKTTLKSVDQWSLGMLTVAWAYWVGSTTVHLLRDIFGNPFRRPPAIDPAWFTWNDSAVVKLAQAIYEQRKFPEGTLDVAQLAVLADLLGEAGCRDTELLGHLRAAGRHVRGCFALDAVLGKDVNS